MLDNFERFCSALRIESKEQGLVPLRLNGCQRYFIQEMRRGMAEGVRNFKVLKGRQFGMSTVSLALDLYWPFTHKGLQGTLVTDTDENKAIFRSILRNYLSNLPRAWKVPVLSFNRTELSLANRSRLIFQVAGVRAASGSLGRGKGTNFMHATECSSWADQDGLASLNASLAENYPDRLYIYESTARGYNMFYELYREAKTAVTSRAIFIGWWQKEDYCLSHESNAYRVYCGDPDPEEREWMAMVKAMYGHEITDGQLAWWRWKLSEEIVDPMMMMQEFPPTEDHAFVLTGSQFFDALKLNDAYEASKPEEPMEFDYRFGTEFYETEIDRVREGMLKIWERPIEGETYVVGADPAYGASDNSDNFAVQVFRCYEDGMDQVAEFRCQRLATYQFAWVIAHLAGAYHGRLNLELNGPGMAVFQEIWRLTPKAATTDNALLNVVAGINHYLYSRPDSASGASNSFHTITSERTKTMYMHAYRDAFERGMLRLKSQDLIMEMKSIRQDMGSIEAQGHGKDDLVIAAGLATLTWVQFELPRLTAMGKTRVAAQRDPGSTPPVLQTTVSRYIASLIR